LGAVVLGNLVAALEILDAVVRQAELAEDPHPVAGRERTDAGDVGAVDLDTLVSRPFELTRVHVAHLHAPGRREHVAAEQAKAGIAVEIVVARVRFTDGKADIAAVDILSVYRRRSDHADRERGRDSRLPLDSSHHTPLVVGCTSSTLPRP